jgi:hypothetical protein
MKQVLGCMVASLGVVAEEDSLELQPKAAKVAVTWWAHKRCSLHKNYFIMAAKADAIYKNYPQSSSVKIVDSAEEALILICDRR